MFPKEIAYLKAIRDGRSRINISASARKAHIHYTYAVTLTKRFESLGWVHRYQNGRECHLTITAVGLKALRDVLK